MNGQYFACFRGSMQDLLIISFINNHWSLSSIIWVLLVSLTAWAFRIILNVFLRKKLVKYTQRFKEFVREKKRHKNKLNNKEEDFEIE